ncbi:hypothetical protein FPV67DRAFT_1444796 [Lyophyllum atratum]|nr:hypothetical protein FPV67DRAFT_1444796 [Lyophyllum atratum]
MAWANRDMQLRMEDIVRGRRSDQVMAVSSSGGSSSVHTETQPSGGDLKPTRWMGCLLEHKTAHQTSRFTSRAASANGRLAKDVIVAHAAYWTSVESLDKVLAKTRAGLSLMGRFVTLLVGQTDVDSQASSQSGRAKRLALLLLVDITWSPCAEKSQAYNTHTNALAPSAASIPTKKLEKRFISLNGKGAGACYRTPCGARKLDGRCFRRIKATPRNCNAYRSTNDICKRGYCHYSADEFISVGNTFHQEKAYLHEARSTRTPSIKRTTTTTVLVTSFSNIRECDELKDAGVKSIGRWSFNDTSVQLIKSGCAAIRQSFHSSIAETLEMGR